MPTTWLQPARGFDSIISYPHNSTSSVLFSDVLQMKVSGIKQLSPGCTAHMHAENLASITSKHVPYLCKHCLDSPQPTHNGQRSTYQPPRVTPIHLPLDGPSNMKTCQKWVVVLTLCTPAGAWTGFSLVHVTLLHWFSRTTSPCCLHTKPKRRTASPHFKASHPWLPLELPRQGLHRTKGRNHTVAIQRHHKEKPAHRERGAGGGRGVGTLACRPGGGAGSSLVRAPVFLFSSHPHLASEAASRRTTSHRPSGSTVCGSHSRACLRNTWITGRKFS